MMPNMEEDDVLAADLGYGSSSTHQRMNERWIGGKVVYDDGDDGANDDNYYSLASKP